MKDKFITEKYIMTMITTRDKNAHKGNFGRVLIIAGSKGMSGACVLAVKGALKSGAGLVTAAVPDEIMDIIQISVPQAMCIDRKKLYSDFDFNKYDTIAIGPGLGVNSKNYNLMEVLFEKYDGTLIIDADGLNTLCRYDDGLKLLKNRTHPTAITPHPGEGTRILNALGIKKSLSREETVKFIAENTKSITLLKGNGTLIKEPNLDEIYVNTTGNPGMATGGSGDVLTGIIAALAADGRFLIDAVKTGCFIHGLAGDLAKEDYGEIGMTSMEIAEYLPLAYMEILDKKKTD